jgi:hypothetical protein
MAERPQLGPKAFDETTPRMTSQSVTLVLLATAAGVLPCAYLGLCLWMLVKKVPRPPFVSYFFLFGVAGGWTFAVAMSPSGLAAVSIIFLIVIAPLSTVLGAALVWSRRSLTWYHRCALALSLCYPALLIVGWLGLTITSASRH